MKYVLASLVAAGVIGVSQGTIHDPYQQHNQIPTANTYEMNLSDHDNKCSDPKALINIGFCIQAVSRVGAMKLSVEEFGNKPQK